MSLLNLFCDVDDFRKNISTWPESNHLCRSNRPGSKPNLSVSEIMTIIINFHTSRFHDFKTYYTTYVLKHLRSEFPDLVSYNRFVELKPLALLPLCLYLRSRMGVATGISFIDATSLCQQFSISKATLYNDLRHRG